MQGARQQKQCCWVIELLLAHQVESILLGHTARLILSKVPLEKVCLLFVFHRPTDTSMNRRHGYLHTVFCFLQAYNHTNEHMKNSAFCLFCPDLHTYQWTDDIEDSAFCLFYTDQHTLQISEQMTWKIQLSVYFSHNSYRSMNRWHGKFSFINGWCENAAIFYRPTHILWMNDLRKKKKASFVFFRHTDISVNT